MTAVHHLIDRELITALGDQERDVQIDVPGVRYLEFDRQPGLSTGIYELGAGVQDPPVSGPTSARNRLARRANHARGWGIWSGFDAADIQSAAVAIPFAKGETPPPAV